jgi:hapalindole H/12-epi-hapalindole U/12-epi-fischerindole U synthase
MTTSFGKSAASAAALCGLVLAAGMLSAPAAQAVPLAVVNHSFEADPNNANEFYFGDPAGWSLIDNNGIIDGGSDVQGTLTVTGSAYFGGSAPDGDNVAILFIGNDVGGGEVGLGQVLVDVLTAGTTYTLTVDVGNINSGPTQQFGNFDLSGFPG